MGDERWLVEFFEADDGTKPAQHYFETLTPGEQQRFRTRIIMLAQKGTWIGRPVVDFLEDNLWELRLENSPHNPRFLFCAVVGRRLLLLHGFSKTGRASNRVPESEKRIARTRREIEEARIEERRRASQSPQSRRARPKKR